jgi:hypothetical protein
VNRLITLKLGARFPALLAVQLPDGRRMLPNDWTEDGAPWVLPWSTGDLIMVSHAEFARAVREAA